MQGYFVIIRLYLTISPNLMLAPSLPVDLMAIDNMRESQRLTITWREPVMTNGIVSSYSTEESAVYAASSDFSQVQMLSVASTMALLQDLVPFSVYNISVRASTGAGPGPYSTEISVRTLEDGECVCRRACPPVQCTVFVCIVAKLKYRPGQESLEGNRGQASTQTNMLKVYRWAWIGAYVKMYFVVSHFVFSVPSAPLELQGIGISSSGLTLEWNPPSTPNGITDFYQVELFTDNNLDLPALNPINVSSTSYNFTGLAPFTGYSVQVCAYTIGCGDIAPLNITTLGGEANSIISEERESTSKPVTTLHHMHLFL